MTAYAEFQDGELDAEESSGYAARTHQRFVGTGYFDQSMETIAGGETSVTALRESTEEEQFDREPRRVEASGSS